MTLPFSTQIEGKPNYFIEKIWRGLLNSRKSPIYMYSIYNNKYAEIFGESWGSKIGLLPKIHTIRQDKSNRWKEGDKIHFVINNRTANQFEFAPVIQCVRIQKIEIIHKHIPMVKIDGQEQSFYELQRLASNDGFDSVEEFFKYFKEDFNGKIIHWTSAIYL
ncbi:hypothetical protein ETU10_08455 [Apibacter muscae]|uniref:hypothetical protein n=1 Tax=Apibacter muscae TaxID=2509004 RepID=UPI0011AD313F|nr:hypothetical protein [Apibacter muscae]TWP23117.1 hypothetical protein ETU10_08455 [Apibacter muscae]